MGGRRCLEAGGDLGWSRLAAKGIESSSIATKVATLLPEGIGQ